MSEEKLDPLNRALRHARLESYEASPHQLRLVARTPSGDAFTVVFFGLLGLQERGLGQVTDVRIVLAERYPPVEMHPLAASMLAQMDASNTRLPDDWVYTFCGTTGEPILEIVAERYYIVAPPTTEAMASDG